MLFRFTIYNDEEYGFALEMFDSNINLFFFITSNPLNIHFVFTVWILKLYIQFIIDFEKVKRLWQKITKSN